jgi:hypothetical protein
MLRRVALVRTDVSEEPGASFIRETGIGELETTQAATSNRRTLRTSVASVASCQIVPNPEREVRYFVPLRLKFFCLSERCMRLHVAALRTNTLLA